MNTAQGLERLEQNRRERRDKERQDFLDAPVQHLYKRSKEQEERISDLEGMVIQLIDELSKVKGEKINIKW